MTVDVVEGEAVEVAGVVLTPLVRRRVIVLPGGRGVVAEARPVAVRVQQGEATWTLPVERPVLEPHK